MTTDGLYHPAHKTPRKKYHRFIVFSRKAEIGHVPGSSRYVSFLFAEKQVMQSRYSADAQHSHAR